MVLGKKCKKTDFGPILRDIVTFSKYQLDSCQLDACIHMAPFESCMLNKVMRVGSIILQPLLSKNLSKLTILHELSNDSDDAYDRKVCVMSFECEGP